MNNALFTDQPAADTPNIEEMERHQGQIEQTIAAVRGLRGDPRYEDFAKWVLRPQLEAAKRRLLRERNQDERTVLQATILTLEKYSDLNDLIAFYANELRGIQFRIAEARRNSQPTTNV